MWSKNGYEFHKRTWFSHPFHYWKCKCLIIVWTFGENLKSWFCYTGEYVLLFMNNANSVCIPKRIAILWSYSIFFVREAGDVKCCTIFTWTCQRKCVYSLWLFPKRIAIWCISLKSEDAIGIRRCRILSELVSLSFQHNEY